MRVVSRVWYTQVTQFNTVPISVRRIFLIALFVLSSGTAIAEPGDATPQPPRPREILRERPSGFWTSNKPTSEPYRWRLLGIGVGLVGVTGFLMWRLIRKK